jgi:hypothetical protein
MRARHPDVAGTVDNDGVDLYYEVFGDGGPTVVLVPTWSLVHLPDVEDGTWQGPADPSGGRGHLRRGRAQRSGEWWGRSQGAGSP